MTRGSLWDHGASLPRGATRRLGAVRTKIWYAGEYLIIINLEDVINMVDDIR